MKKKNNGKPVVEHKAQTAVSTKKQRKQNPPPVKTLVTDSIRNTADRTEGLNQSTTDSEELLPLD
jgi:hypothetical protein